MYKTPRERDLTRDTWPVELFSEKGPYNIEFYGVCDWFIVEAVRTSSNACALLSAYQVSLSTDWVVVGVGVGVGVGRFSRNPLPIFSAEGHRQ